MLLTRPLALSQVAKAKESQKSDFPEGIPECGADALRFGLLAYTVQGRDVNLDIKRVVGYRQFCNKIWNAFRFAVNYVGDFIPSPSMVGEIASSAATSKRDLFILSRLNATIKECNLHIGGYLFGAATSALHSFFLYDVCDVYLELLKPVIADKSEANADKMRMAQTTLYVVLEQFLRLIHPMMPFVTEELWQRLPNRTSLTSVESICVATYPEAVDEWFNPAVEHDMELVKEAIHGARSLRNDYRVPNHVKADFYFRTDSEEIKAALIAQADDFCTLAKGNCFKYVDSSEATPKGWCVKVLSDQLSLLVDLSGLIDVETELARLTKEIERLTPLVDSYKRKMAAGDYETKVPENVRAVNTEKLGAYETELSAVMKAIEAFELMK